MADLRPGFYRHFKNLPYQLIDIARHSETQEEFVVYRALYGERALWIRPKDMFMENVTRDGVTMKRFAFVSEELPEGWML